jgi:hypothetical protein
MRLILTCILIFLSSLPISFAQGSAGDGASYESIYIIDQATAGVLRKGDFSIYTQTYPQGGVMVALSAAPFTNFNMGFSYSGTNIVGMGSVDWQNIPGIQLKLRLFDERVSLPAILIGVNTQGRESYLKGSERFMTNSAGIYLALSKNYIWALGNIAFHGGINYSFDPPSDNRSPNFYVGMEQSLGSKGSLNVEFNPTMDEYNTEVMNKKGMLNLSIRWSIYNGITVELQARDVLEHYQHAAGFRRSLVFEYVSTF